MVPALAASGPSDEPGALEKDSQGWIDMLATAGPELDGWTRRPIPPTASSIPSRNGRSTRRPAISSARATAAMSGCAWTRTLTDCIFHVEWRFTPVPGKKGYNSGVYVRNSSDAKIWHQAQSGNASGGYLFGETRVLRHSSRSTFKTEVQEQRVKPAGEWNTFEITCKGKDVTLWVNGAVTNQWHDCRVPRGYVGLEAEGWRIEFRNVKVKLL